jgi:adenosylcobinamide-phosphate synthase
VKDRAEALGLVAGYMVDRAVGDPRRGHPVALFGRAAGAAQRLMWADSRTRGVVYLATCVGAAAGLGALTRMATRRHPFARFASTAIATWAVLGGRSLAEEGIAMARLLEDGDLPAARRRLSHLCGRDAANLNLPELARAATESVAENTSDAVVAPLLWGAVAGVPGLLGYRALNTLDAMVGHRTARFARFGWACARADDLANLVPARLAALAAVCCSPLVGGRPLRTFRVWRRDAARHPSPNAGQIEAAFAGALEVRLGGVNSYHGAAEDRGTLGTGPAPGPADLRRSVTLSKVVGLAALAVAVERVLKVRALPDTTRRAPRRRPRICDGTPWRHTVADGLAMAWTRESAAALTKTLTKHHLAR